LAAPRRAAAHIRANFDTKMTRRVFGQVRPAAHRASCQVSILLRRQCIVMCASGGLRRNARPGAVCPMWAYSTRSHPKMAHLPCNAQTGARRPLSCQNHTFGLQVILPASWVGWSACWIALQVLSHASGGTHIAQPCPSLRLGTWKLDASHWDVRAGVGPHWPAEHTPRLWHAPFGARCPGLLSACSHMQVRAPTAQDLPPH